MGDRVEGYGTLRVEGGALQESVTGACGPVLLASTLPEVGRGDVLAGRYQIEAVIGTGGSGRVLRVFDRVARAPVALKILRPEFAADPVWTERFSRELRVGRQIQHPNVCRVFDIGESEGHRFLSMELAIGGTIRAQLEASETRALEDRIADARAVIDGVAALHAANIIHRDLKPENILRMEDGRLVVSDFGLATDPTSGPTATIMIGTPRYMAPEVVMGEPVTLRSDVWALGVVLHEILFGRRPERSVVRHGYRRFTVPKVGSLKERLLAELCGRCSEEDPNLRPASAAQVRREFQMAVLGQRVVTSGLRGRIVWGAIAVATLVTLAFVRNHATNSAVASSSGMANSIASRVLQPSGIPADWRKGATTLASFPGRLHCFSLEDGGRKVRAIWGNPSVAVDVDVATGARHSASLLPETFEEGCPQTSPNGRSLLFERNRDGVMHVFLSSTPDGRDARRMVRGSSPAWLPNSLEFAFELDSRHAAMFSVPTGEMTVVGDAIVVPRQLAEKAVDPTGTRIAIRYFTETLDNLIVVHSLPSLNLVGNFLVPASARRLQFSDDGERLLFPLDGSHGFAQMVSADWRTRTLTTVGTLADADVRGLLATASGSIVASRTLRKDLWLTGAGESKRLTEDGQSDEGSISREGDLVIQRRLPDGRFVIVFKPANGPESQVTNGPLDMTPSFFPDGTKWLYVNYTSHEIVVCRVADKQCAPIFSDPLSPQRPTVDPTGQQVAYVTFMNMPRLHVLSLISGAKRDLGPVSQACAPFWISPTRVWAAQSTGHERLWAEIDTTTGNRTGRVRKTNPSANECAIPEDVLAQAPTALNRRVTVVVDERSELLTRRGAR